MAKSYKKEYISILEKISKEYKVVINNTEIPLYTVNKDYLLCNIDLQQVANHAGLKGKTKPIAIVQYGTINPMDGTILPLIAFIWSWGGPWAFVYNIQYPSWSESGSVPYNRIKQFAGYKLNSAAHFLSRE